MIIPSLLSWVGGRWLTGCLSACLSSDQQFSPLARHQLLRHSHVNWIAGIVHFEFPIFIHPHTNSPCVSLLSSPGEWCLVIAERRV